MSGRQLSRHADTSAGTFRGSCQNWTITRGMSSPGREVRGTDSVSKRLQTCADRSSSFSAVRSALRATLTVYHTGATGWDCASSSSRWPRSSSPVLKRDRTFPVRWSSRIKAGMVPLGWRRRRRVSLPATGTLETRRSGLPLQEVSRFVPWYGRLPVFHGHLGSCALWGRGVLRPTRYPCSPSRTSTGPVGTET